MSDATPPTIPMSPSSEPQSGDLMHLQLLVIFHYIQAGLTALGICGGGLYVAIGLALSSASAQSTNPSDPPEAVGWIMAAVGGFVFLYCLAMATLYFFDARWIAQRRHRLFTQVMAGFSCLSIPLGTALGIYTFVVMSRPGVKAMYAATQGRSDDRITD